MPFKKDLTNFLENTTVHGVKHLLSGSLLKRSIWLLAVAAAFVLSSYIFVLGFLDNDVSPFVTVVRSTPITEVAFPSVTLFQDKEAKIEEPEVIWRVMNNVRYDCSGYEKLGDCGRVSKVKRNTQLQTNISVSLNFVTILQVAFKLVAFVNSPPCSLEEMENPEYAHITTPWKLMNELIPDKYLVLNKIMRVMVSHGNHQEVCQHLSEVAIVVFGMSVEDKIKSINAFLSHYGEDGVDNPESCNSTELLELWNNHSPDHLYMHACVFAFVYSQASAKPEVRAGELFFSPRRENVTLLKETYFDPEVLLNKKTSGFDKRSQEYYAHLLLRQKFQAAHISKFIEEESDIQEVMDTIDAVDMVDLYGYDETEMAQPFPVVNADAFLEQEQRANRKPQYFRSFSDAGIAWTLNSGPFWDKFKPTESMHTFYEKMVKKHKHYVIDDSVMYPKGNGPNNAYLALMDFSGIYWTINIHHYSDLPQRKKEPIHLEENRVYSIAVTPTVYDVDGNVDAMDPKDKNCISKHDKEHYNLTLFKTYSQSGCTFECKIRKAASVLGCYSSQYPRLNENLPSCSLEETDFEVTKDIYSKEEMTKVNPTTECTECLEDCHRTVYSTYITSVPNQFNTMCQHHNPTKSNSPIKLLMPEMTHNYYSVLRGRPDEVEIFLGENPNSVLSNYYAMCSYYSRYYKVVRLYVAPREAMVFTRTLRQTFADKVANFGGTVGLFTGMSLLSLLEVLCYLWRMVTQQWWNIIKS